MIGRRWLVVPLLAACLPALAGCPAPGAVTDVDRQRLAVLEREKIVGTATGKLDSSAGFLISSTLPPSRGKVYGRIVAASGSTVPAPAGTAVTAVTRTEARTSTARSIETLRGSGWTVYFVGCTPPGDSASPGAVRPWPYPEPDRWLFDAFAYKVIGGVSYFAHVAGMATDTGTAQVYFTLLAPNEHESVTNLFPDTPPAVSPSANCVESPVEPTKPTHAGPVLAMFESGPRAGTSAPLAATGYR
jgi:hypothetical protein